MKILHIIPNMYTGGAEKFCIDICNELAKDSELDVTICSVEKLNDKQQIMYKKISPNVKFISLNKEGKNPIFIFKIIKMLFSLKPDITHTHLRAQMFAALGLILYRKANIHTIHSVADKETTKGRLKFYKFLYDYFNFTPVSISEQVLKSAQKLYGQKQSVMISNGAQKLQKTDKYEETKNFIDSLKSDQNSKIFVSVGRFYSVKNQELLIKAFEKLLEEGFDVHLLILGALDVVPTYAKKCTEMIKRDDRIHVMGEVSNVSDYLLESDVLCFSSIYEGFPISIIEAMSIGVPTISTPVGGILDVIEDGKNGYLSKDMSVESYKEALKRVIVEDTIDKNALISEYKDKYSVEKCAQKYLELYSKKF